MRLKNINPFCQDGGQGRPGRASSLGAWTGEGPPPIPSKPEMIKNINSKKRQDELELRHQELLARQRQLQVGREMRDPAHCEGHRKVL